MRHRVILAAAGVLMSALGVAAQERSTTPATSYGVPRTPDGRPDLQGFWTNLTYTPFERPRDLAAKPFFTEQEAVDFFNRSIAGSQDQIVHYVNGDFGATPVQTGARPNLRTSLVIDPADGRIPPLTPEAQKRQQALLAADKARGPLAQTWRDDRGTVWCVFHDRAVPAIVAPYGSNYHIVQSKDWIVMTYEWNSERRLIALDGRPHAPASFRTYTGDARGHWEGDTLVVETTNFTPKRIFLGQPGTPPAISASPALTLVERFTRTADDTIVHTYTVTDAATWTRPWTVELPMHRINGPMLEYACNENNQDGFAALKNARLEEAGKLAPLEQMRRGDAKAAIAEHEEKGAATVIGVDGKDEAK
jgi:hypothetical protein